MAGFQELSFWGHAWESSYVVLVTMTIDVVTEGCFQASLFHRTVDSLKCVPGAGIRPKIFEVPFNEGTYTFTLEYTPVNSIWRKEK